jgi:hypothetical protein
METSATPKPSFTKLRRWTGTLNATLASAALLALVVMINYLASSHYVRWNVSRDMAFKLSRQTRNVVGALTNDVKVTLFFEKQGPNEELYLLASALLAEYQGANPRHVHVGALDYKLLPGPAKDLITKYNIRGQDKDFVLFECNGHQKVVYAREMANYDFSDLLAGRSKYVRRNEFKGEMLFTSAIYTVSYPQALKTYFLYGHGENDPGKPGGEAESLGRTGYSKLAAILKEQMDSEWERIWLQGTNVIPQDCQLLIVAGPPGRGRSNAPVAYSQEEIEKIGAYLKGGGRLLALLTQPCGLDNLLAKQWGVRLGTSRVVDRDPNYYSTDNPFLFQTAELFQHPIIDPLAKDRIPILMVYPRPLFPVEDHGKIPGGPEVKMLAATSGKGVDLEGHAGTYDLLAAVEQGGIKGVDTPRGGGTRIVVAGDSDFLDDQWIESCEGNSEFAYLALNWLLQRPAIQLEGLAPRPIREYKLYLTDAESRRVHWLFLAGMPAGALALGGLVWLRRRH